jgi:hypothetical protein
MTVACHRENEKRAAGNPLSADGPEVLFLLPKVEDNPKVEHAHRESKSTGQKEDSRPG